MKLYILPIEKACNARCPMCITNYRKIDSARPMQLDILAQRLDMLPSLEKIEITGGGEPTLHKQIGEVISMCSQKAPTQMYTHGATPLDRLCLEQLSLLCLSRMHHENHENERLMGISYNVEELCKNSPVPIKLSLVVYQDGINSGDQLRSYLSWAQEHGIRQVVVRQVFEHEDPKYLPVQALFVSSETLYTHLYDDLTDHTLTPQENPLAHWNDVLVEFEYRSCACEMDNPVLHANGRITQGWNYDLDWVRNP